jgi:6-pyruvoyltetrahydropterin/6-carboxytetrahydropterin synthase
MSAAAHSAPRVAVSKRYRFPAAHVLRSPALSDQENARLYGKCSNLHGHDYGVEVTVTGPVEPGSGQIIAPERLDQLVDRFVLGPLAHTDLSRSPLFAERVSTAENVARVLYDQLAGPVAEEGRARLLRIRVQETRRNAFEYGDDA